LRVNGPDEAFTIVEAVVAAALLLATCIAISAVLSSATKADSAAGDRAGLEGVLASECQRLAVLPYSECDIEAGRTAGAPTPDSLVSEVFPWARPELNTDDRRFVDDVGGDAAGTFVSIVEADGIRTRRDAVFLADERDVARHLGVADLAGWDCTSGARPPASSLAVTVEVSARGRSVSRTMVLTALRPSVAPSPQPTAG
jgi:hypothetical protein